uniref:RING-type domain-containing protein n=2 Tax=Auxenochlorella protothecoides TaxID=3075 RepID=A0A1D1ZNW8_AUXPR
MGQALGREVPVADLDALHVAIAEGHCVTVHQILGSSPSPARLVTARHPDSGGTALHVSCRACCLRCLDACLSPLLAASLRQPSLLSRALDAPSSRTGTTALMTACGRGFDPGAVLLIAAGADAALSDRVSGVTALHCAAAAGAATCVAALLSEAVTARGPAGRRVPLRGLVLEDCAGRHAYRDLRADHGLAPLHCAALHGGAAAVAALLRGGANAVALTSAHSTPPGAEYARQSTPLHLAAVAGDEASARALIQSTLRGRLAGLDIRRYRDARGHRPVDLARRLGAAPSLVAMLDPATPLRSVVQPVARPRRAARDAPPGPASLAVVAAGAVRRNLLRELAAREEGLRAAAGAQPRHRPASLLARLSLRARCSTDAGVRRGSAPAPGSPAERAAGAASASPTHAHGLFDVGSYLELTGEAGRADAAAAPLSLPRLSSCTSAGSEALCPVCMDAAPGVRLAGCGHAFCAACLRQVVAGERGPVPLRCPLCRGAAYALEPEQG